MALGGDGGGGCGSLVLLGGGRSGGLVGLGAVVAREGGRGGDGGGLWLFCFCGYGLEAASCGFRRLRFFFFGVAASSFLWLDSLYQSSGLRRS